MIKRLALTVLLLLLFPLPAKAAQGAAPGVTVTNKYVEGEIEITALTDALALIEAFEGQETYEIDDGMEVLAAFSARSSADFSGTLTQVRIPLTSADYRRLAVVHDYGGGFEAVPVTPAEDEFGLSVSFHTSYGLGDFVLLASPAAGEAPWSQAPQSGAAESSQSSTAESSQSGALPQNLPAPQAPPPLLRTLLYAAAVLAAALAVILVCRRKNGGKQR